MVASWEHTRLSCCPGHTVRGCVSAGCSTCCVQDAFPAEVFQGL